MDETDSSLLVTGSHSPGEGTLPHTGSHRGCTLVQHEPGVREQGNPWLPREYVMGGFE